MQPSKMLDSFMKRLPFLVLLISACSTLPPVLPPNPGSVELTTWNEVRALYKQEFGVEVPLTPPKVRKALTDQQWRDLTANTLTYPGQPNPNPEAGKVAGFFNPPTNTVYLPPIEQNLRTLYCHEFVHSAEMFGNKGSLGDPQHKNVRLWGPTGIRNKCIYKK